MSVNVGTLDRGIRFVIGVVALAAAFVGPIAAGGWDLVRIGLLAVGAIMLLTSALKFCPLYRIFGLRTCRID